jgi:biotin carboxyl carrier protein
MELTVQLEGRSYQVRVGKEGTAVDGKALRVEFAPPGVGPVRTVRVDGRSFRLVPHREEGGAWTLGLAGVRHRIEVIDALDAATRFIRASLPDSGGPPPLRAPMPGLVVRVEVREGDVVEAGQGVVIVEAMKMENELRSPSAARVRKVRARVGEAVEKDQLLVEFDLLEEGA